MRVSDPEALSLTLKECLVEVVTLERTLTELDHVRLLNLLRREARGDGSSPQFRAIEDVLDASALVPSREVAPDVVTMYSQVLLQDTQTGQRNTLTLVLPRGRRAGGWIRVGAVPGRQRPARPAGRQHCSLVYPFWR